MGIEIEFRGSGVDEKGYVSKCNHPSYQLPLGQEVVYIDPRYFRPAEVDLLVGDPAKAMSKLGWKPTYDLSMLVKEMMEQDLLRESK